MMLGMKSQVSFDASVLTAPSPTAEPANDIIIQSSDNTITGEPLINVPLCAPAAKFLSESQKRILIPDIQESEDDDGEVNETTSIVNNINLCKKTFTKEEVLIKHKKSNHKKGYNPAGDQRCEECSYRTNFAAHYLNHILNTHADKELARTIKSLKPVDSAVIYMLAEQNMALAEESKRMKKDIDYIKKALEPKSKAAKFSCQKCKELCASPTRIQEHMLEDHCCKYCDKVFASRTEKERHKKYMCVKCELTFSHNIELNIHTRTFHKEPPEVMRYHCTECSQEAKTEEDIVKHIETKHAAILSPVKISKPVPDPNVTKYHCPECSQEEKSEEDIVKHIETRHSEIFRPAKISKPIPAPRSKKPEVINVSGETKTFKCIECDHQEMIEDDLIRHMENKHIIISNQESSEPTNQDSHKCRMCDHSASSKELLRQHIQINHSKYVNLPNWFMIGDSHLNSVNPRMVEKATGGKLFCPGSIHPKEGRAYCSTRQWPNAKFPHNNHTDMVPRLLSQRPFKGGIILSPGNDISNLAALDRNEQYTMAAQSARNMVGVAERALRDNSTLEKLVMVH